LQTHAADKTHLILLCLFPFMKEMKEIKVRKESGEFEPYDRSKIENAMTRAGLSAKAAQEILSEFEPQLYDNISTKKIFALLYDLIDREKPEVSHRYNLKHALVQLGPAGYEFEDFTARLLSLDGYRTEVRQMLQGRCVMHEVDVVAEDHNEVLMTECKFHSSGGLKCRIQVALYTYARFLDLVEGAKLGRCRHLSKPFLVCNTKFSSDVLEYADCMGFPLLGWHYPFDNGLEALIEKRKCYPISVIPVASHVLAKLLAKKIVTVFDLPESASKLVDMTGISLQTAKFILEKAEYAR